MEGVGNQIEKGNEEGKNQSWAGYNRQQLGKRKRKKNLRLIIRRQYPNKRKF